MSIPQKLPMACSRAPDSSSSSLFSAKPCLRSRSPQNSASPAIFSLRSPILLWVSARGLPGCFSSSAHSGPDSRSSRRRGPSSKDTSGKRASPGLAIAFRSPRIVPRSRRRPSDKRPCLDTPRQWLPAGGTRGASLLLLLPVNILGQPQAGLELIQALPAKAYHHAGAKAFSPRVVDVFQGIHVV